MIYPIYCLLLVWPRKGLILLMGILPSSFSCRNLSKCLFSSVFHHFPLATLWNLPKENCFMILPCPVSSLLTSPPPLKILTILVVKDSTAAVCKATPNTKHTSSLQLIMESARLHSMQQDLTYKVIFLFQIYFWRINNTIMKLRATNIFLRLL